VENGLFRFSLEIPLAVGTVGGLTSLHPIARTSFELLGNPSLKSLMMIIAATGLAQNFAAVRSLVTTGIQEGHMRLHLGNILSRMGASDIEKLSALSHFEDKIVSVSEVRAYLDVLRSVQIIPTK
jgi:hydroxymethylglutaryl-CoA reductase